MGRYRQLDADFALATFDADEDLPAPADNDPAWLRRSRRPAGALVVLLAAGGVVLHLTGTSGPAPPPVSKPVAENIVEVRQQPVTGAASGLVSDDLGTACPADASCRTSTRLPSGTAAALDATFPGADQVTAHTVLLPSPGGERLLGRFVHASTAGADVTVQLLPQRARPSVSVSGAGGGSIVVVERAAGSVTVRVTVGGPLASARPGSPALRLAADPRLAALS